MSDMGPPMDHETTTPTEQSRVGLHCSLFTSKSTRAKGNAAFAPVKRRKTLKSPRTPAAVEGEAKVVTPPICVTNDVVHAERAQEALAKDLGFDFSSDASAEIVASKLYAVKRYQLFSPPRRAERREALQHAFQLHAILQSRGHEYIAKFAESRGFDIPPDEDHAAMSLECFFDFGGETSPEKKQGAVERSRNCGVLRQLARLGVDPTTVADFLATPGNDVDSLYRQYTKAEKAARGSKVSQSGECEPQRRPLSEFVKSQSQPGEWVLFVSINPADANLIEVVGEFRLPDLGPVALGTLRKKIARKIQKTYGARPAAGSDASDPYEPIPASLKSSPSMACQFPQDRAEG